MRRLQLCGSLIFMLAAAAAGKNCDEFLSQPTCVVVIPIYAAVTQHRAPTHSDVQTKVNGNAGVELTQASPFLTCTIQGTTSAPARDLSVPVASLLATVGGFGAPAVAENKEEVKPPPKPADLPALKKQFQDELDKNWLYTFPNEDAGRNAVNNLKSRLPVLLDAETDLENETITRLNGATPSQAEVIKDALNDLRKVRDTIRQYANVVIPLMADDEHPFSEIDLAMDQFKQKGSSGI